MSDQWASLVKIAESIDDVVQQARSERTRLLNGPFTSDQHKGIEQVLTNLEAGRLWLEYYDNRLLFDQLAEESE